MGVEASGNYLIQQSEKPWWLFGTPWGKPTVSDSFHNQLSQSVQQTNRTKLIYTYNLINFQVDENEEEAASEDEDHVSHRASDNRLITPEIEEVPGDIPGTMKSRDLRSILEGDMDLRPSRQTQASLGQRSVMRNRLSAARSTLLQKLSQRRWAILYEWNGLTYR